MSFSALAQPFSSLSAWNYVWKSAVFSPCIFAVLLKLSGGLWDYTRTCAVFTPRPLRGTLFQMPSVCWAQSLHSFPETFCFCFCFFLLLFFLPDVLLFSILLSWLLSVLFSLSSFLFSPERTKYRGSDALSLETRFFREGFFFFGLNSCCCRHSSHACAVL